MRERKPPDPAQARRSPPPEASLKPQAGGALQTHFKTDGFAILSFHNVLIVVWTTASTVFLVEQLSRHSIQFHKNHPGGVSVVHMIAKGPPLPEPEVRERFSELLGKNPKTLACVGVVLEGRGFWASAVRSFLVGLRVLSPRTVQMQAFSTTRELASWLVEPHAARTSVRIDTPELERILDRARASVEGDREGVSP